MPNKQAIFDNIEQYSAPELLKFIEDGLVSLDELIEETEGYFPAETRKEVQRLLASSESSEQRDWQKASEENTEDAYMAFLGHYPQSKYADDARNAIRTLHTPAEQDLLPSAWAEVDKDDEQSLRKFISDYPDDPHCQEARKLLNKLAAERYVGYDAEAFIAEINSIYTDPTVNDQDEDIGNYVIQCLEKHRITREELLEMIKQDNNLLRATVVKRLINEGYFEYSDFENIGIDAKFVRHLAKEHAPVKFEKPRPLERINKVSTEIYFWGIPSSGKTCALSAILSVAGNGKVARSMAKDPDCQGYGYMTRLAQLFKTDGSIGITPLGTSVTSTYEMGFDLEDEKGDTHPITCIDLAGELFRCMYKSDAREELAEDEEKALEAFHKVLIDCKSVNRKMHFFVLEYGGESRLYEGLSQSVYLDAALRYIDRTKIFETATDAIYLMITKTDKVGAKGTQLVDALTRYIDENYKGFYQGLESLCKKYEINGGRVERIPFSLGEVCFRDFCLFNETPAANVVRTILMRSKGFKNGKLQNALNRFKR